MKAQVVAGKVAPFRKWKPQAAHFITHSLLAGKEGKEVSDSRSADQFL